MLKMFPKADLEWRQKCHSLTTGRDTGLDPGPLLTTIPGLTLAHNSELGSSNYVQLIPGQRSNNSLWWTGFDLVYQWRNYKRCNHSCYDDRSTGKNYCDLFRKDHHMQDYNCCPLKIHQMCLVNKKRPGIRYNSSRRGNDNILQRVGCNNEQG